MATISEKLANLDAAVVAEGTVEGSVTALVTNLAQMVKDLKEDGTDPATAARIDALVSQLLQSTQRMGVAVTAHTPAQPAPTLPAAPALAPAGPRPAKARGDEHHT